MLPTTNNNPETNAKCPRPSRGPRPSMLARFRERQRCLAAGFEPPVSSAEAADYLGLAKRTLEEKTRRGEIPGHPAFPNRRRNVWKYFVSELDAYLRAQVKSTSHPCSPR
ncbi:MAG: hypothetical protein DMG61_14860 [Acidobacteria bacterium]|nr:MAG: hypothetical protein DMG61_14860 [Acidobacteriota bacterium]